MKKKSKTAMDQTIKSATNVFQTSSEIIVNNYFASNPLTLAKSFTACTVEPMASFDDRVRLTLNNNVQESSGEMKAITEIIALSKMTSKCVAKGHINLSEILTILELSNLGLERYLSIIARMGDEKQLATDKEKTIRNSSRSSKAVSFSFAGKKLSSKPSRA